MDSWPEPPPPRRAMAWTRDAGSWSAVGPTGVRWRIDALADGRFAVTIGDAAAPDRVLDSPAAARALVETFEARHDDPAVAVLGMSSADAVAARDALVAAAEARVTDWRWGPAYAGWERFEPYWDERHGEAPKTRRRRAEPQNKSRWEQFGFAADGTVAVSRMWGYFFEPD